MQELVKGQKTKVFEGNPIPEYEVSRVCNTYLYVEIGKTLNPILDGRLVVR